MSITRPLRHSILQANFVVLAAFTANGFGHRHHSKEFHDVTPFLLSLTRRNQVFLEW